MSRRKTRVAVLALATGGLLAISGAAQAALHDRGGGLVYDDALNVTWLQDANYAKTSGYDADGGMSWGSAVTWAANLSFYDSVRNVTYTDWRLPTLKPVDGITWNINVSFNGTTDGGFNESAPGTPYAGSTASELAYMFYQNLGNPSIYLPSLPVTESSCAGGSCLQNTGPFVNLTPIAYWTGIESGYDTSQAWTFRMDSGMQGTGYKDHPNNTFYAWAVRDGDVAVVPEADTWVMLLAGLGIVGVAARRRRTELIKTK